jgi:hypothetical protein
MSKTKRRNIKKRNTRRKNSKMSLKNRTKYTNNKRKYKNTNRKTIHHRNQRGGVVSLVRIDEETGNHIYYSDLLRDIIEVAPLPETSTKTYDKKQHDQQTLDKMAIAGIQNTKGMAPIPDVNRYIARQAIRVMPKAGNISVPEQVRKAEQAIKVKKDEVDKQYTILLAEQEENRRIQELESLMFEPSGLSSPTGKKLPEYLNFTEKEHGISPTSARTPPVSSLAKSPGFKYMHLSSAERKDHRPQSVSSGSDNDSDLGGDEEDVIAKLKRELKEEQDYIQKHGVRPRPLRQLKKPSHGAVALGRPMSPDIQPKPSLFQALRTKVNKLVSYDIERRLTDVFRTLHTSSETQEIIRKCPPCLQHYILFRLEGQGITKEMIMNLIAELRGGNGPQLHSLLIKHELFPIPKTLWVPDHVCKRSAIPHDGGNEFSVFTRRHHCRCCGRCITSEYYVDSLKVCTECDRLLTRM